MAEEIERVNYYQLEYLGAEDFKAEQAYHRDMRRRHNVAHHLWGIVTGLEIVEIAKGSGTGYDVYVQPGFAIDGFGREIIVTAPHKLDAVDFRALETGKYGVWIAYREQLDTPPAAGYAACTDDEQNKRVREEFRIVVDPKPPTHPPVIVGGKVAVRKSDPAAPTAPVVIPDDESVPYQDFPEDRERWLIRLGTVSWKKEGQFFDGTIPAELLREGRMYTGIVAENLLSPVAKPFLRPRDFTAGKEDDADFAEVQGRLQVDGRIVAKKDIYLHGGRLWLQLPNGSDDNAPQWIHRKPPAGPIAYDLRVNIGPKTTPPNEKPHRLSIATDGDDVAKAKAVLAVRSDDNVDITTGKLNFGVAADALRQIVNFRGENFGIGVQKTGMLYHRTESSYAWYRGGQHDDTERQPGPGGTLAMELTSTNKLRGYGSIEASSIRAPLVIANDLHVYGGKVEFLDATGDPNTDELSLTRFHHFHNQNDLRVTIGDDVDGLDSFTVGPYHNNQYKTQFQVRNNGNVSMTGDLTLNAGRTIHVGAMKLGGSFPVDVYIMRHVINATNTSGLTAPIQIVSRMPVVSSASVHVALSNISNAGTAVNAGWFVAAANISVAGNVVSFQISYSVSDIDGHLGSATAIIVMVP
jgi:hypothetical protein